MRIVSERIRRAWTGSALLVGLLAAPLASAQISDVSYEIYTDPAGSAPPETEFGSHHARLSGLTPPISYQNLLTSMNGSGASISGSIDASAGLSGAGGTGSVDLTNSGSNSYQFMTGLSVFDFLFTPTEDTPTRLQGSLAVSGSTGTLIHGNRHVARYQIHEVVVPNGYETLLEEQEITVAGQLVFDRQILMEAGHTYKVTGYAWVFAGTIVDPFATHSSASWDLAFSVVPEPSTALLLGLGLAVLSGRRPIRGTRIG